MNFQEALNTKVDEIERPPLLPMGTYRWLVEKHPALDTIANGRFDVCDFILKCVEAKDDVDVEDLQAYIENAGDLSGARIRHRFMFNKEDEGNFKRSMFNLKRFITEHLGVGEEAGMSLKELLAQSVGQQCLGTIKWRPDQNDPEIQYAEIGTTAPVE